MVTVKELIREFNVGNLEDRLISDVLDLDFNGDFMNYYLDDEDYDDVRHVFEGDLHIDGDVYYVYLEVNPRDKIETVNYTYALKELGGFIREGAVYDKYADKVGETHGCETCIKVDQTKHY